MTVTPMLIERFALKNTGYKRNGLGVWCPSFRVRTWWLIRYCLDYGDGVLSEPMTKAQALRRSKEKTCPIAITECS